MKDADKDSESNHVLTNTNNTPVGEIDEDLAALELNDELFNIADMEDFVNENEDFHMCMDDDNKHENNSVSDYQDSDGKQSKTTQPLRLKYCDNDEIELLETLYTQNANDGND